MNYYTTRHRYTVSSALFFTAIMVFFFYLFAHEQTVQCEKRFGKEFKARIGRGSTLCIDQFGNVRGL